MRPFCWMAIAWLAACSTEEACLEAQDDARAQAINDALDCAFVPDAVDPQDCTRFDRRVRSAYIGAWCATAEMACLEADGDAVEACFGRPVDP